MSNSPTFDPSAEKAAELYRAVGIIASLWSTLERSVDSACWQLAGIAEDPGACLTSQLPSARSKLLALEALVRLRGGSENLLKRLRMFRDKRCQPAADKRNRAVHDPIWIEGPETVTVSTITVAPNKGLLRSERTPDLAACRS